MYSKGIRILIGVVFIVCVVGSAMGYQIIFAKSTNNQSSASPFSYSKNENGQTYGLINEANSVEMLPDLIHMGTINDIAGYVLKKDYLGEDSRDVPLYDVDGKTIIGSIHIGAKNMNYPKNKNGQT
jgi:hypothetical protein